MLSTQVVELEHENLRLNGVDGGKACVLDWRDRDAARRLGKFDLILGADLLYASAIVKVLHFASVALLMHLTLHAPMSLGPVLFLLCQSLLTFLQHWCMWP